MACVFLLKLTLNRPSSEEISALLPVEKKRGKELAEQGAEFYRSGATRVRAAALN